MNYNTIRPISTDALRRIVPSAFAETAYHGTSNKYEYIPSYPMLELLQGQGFQPIKAIESRTRIDDKRGYVKHMIQLVNTDLKVPSVGDTFQAITLTNAHDATAAFRFYSALYRLVCGNGMTSQIGSKQDELRILHNAKAIQELRTKLPEIMANNSVLAQLAANFATINLTPNEQGIYAEAALELRWEPTEEGRSTAPIQPDRLLTVRRQADHRIKNSLWGTWNIVQENLVQGGLRGRNANGGRTSTREIKSVDADVKLNRALSVLAQRMAELKLQAA